MQVPEAELEMLAAQIRDRARAAGLAVWDAVPGGGAEVAWPGAADDLDGFLASAEQFAAPVLYAELVRVEGEELPESCLLGYAVAGVLHTFTVASVEVVERRLAEWEHAKAELAAERETGEELSFEERWRGEKLEQALGDLLQPSYDDEIRAAQRELLPAAVRDVIASLVDDETYDPRYARGNAALLRRERSSSLPEDEQQLVEAWARDGWSRREEELDRAARRLAEEILARPDVDLFGLMQQRSAARALLAPSTPEQVVVRVDAQAKALLRETGAYERAYAELRAEAAARVAALDQDLVDQITFTHRRAPREQLLEPATSDHHSASHLRREMLSLLDEARPAVEQRYATAARQLIPSMSRTAAARKLGMSGSVVDRIVSTYANDVDLDADDPLWAVLDRPAVPRGEAPGGGPQTAPAESAPDVRLADVPPAGFDDPVPF